jgi:hypothetical protein
VGHAAASQRVPDKTQLDHYVKPVLNGESHLAFFGCKTEGTLYVAIKAVTLCNNCTGSTGLDK